MSGRWSDVGLCHQVNSDWSCRGPWAAAGAERGPGRERITCVTPWTPGPGRKSGGVPRSPTAPGDPPLPLPGLSLLLLVAEGGARPRPAPRQCPRPPSQGHSRFIFAEGRDERKEQANSQTQRDPRGCWDPALCVHIRKLGPRETVTSLGPPEGQACALMDHQASARASARARAPPPAARPCARRLFFVSRGHHDYGSRRLWAAASSLRRRDFSSTWAAGTWPRRGTGGVGSSLGADPERGASL